MKVSLEIWFLFAYALIISQIKTSGADGCDKNNNPCKNGGICQPNDDKTSFECVCAPGFTGKLCADTSSCYPDPCLNGGVCEEAGTNQFKCSCAGGFDGILCEIEVNECSSRPCKNNGVCVDAGNHYKCFCPNDLKFYGENCEEYNPCYNNPCDEKTEACINELAIGGKAEKDPDTEFTCVPYGYSCSCMFDNSYTVPIIGIILVVAIIIGMVYLSKVKHVIGKSTRKHKKDDYDLGSLTDL